MVQKRNPILFFRHPDTFQEELNLTVDKHDVAGMILEKSTVSKSGEFCLYQGSIITRSREATDATEYSE